MVTVGNFPGNQSHYARRPFFIAHNQHRPFQIAGLPFNSLLYLANYSVS